MSFKNELLFINKFVKNNIKVHFFFPLLRGSYSSTGQVHFSFFQFLGNLLSCGLNSFFLILNSLLLNFSSFSYFPICWLLVSFKGATFMSSSFLFTLFKFKNKFILEYNEKLILKLYRILVVKFWFDRW